MNIQSGKNKFLSSIIDYTELFIVAVCAVIILFSGLLRICTVDGPSMENTLHTGEVLVVSDAMYTPSRGDIVVFHQTGANYNKPLVKRVIGIGGDKLTIDFDNWNVQVTDKSGNTFELDEDYRNISGVKRYTGIHEYNVPEGSLFVMGDNRNNSADSRDIKIGYVDERRVLGKVIIRVSPLSKFGTID